MDIFGFFIPSEYITLLLIIHCIISIVITFFVAFYISRRYVKAGEKVKEKDMQRLEQIANRSVIFKTLFKISLHKNNPISIRLFFFIFNISVPVVGYLASLWLAYYLVHIRYDKKIIHTNMLNLDEFGTSFLKVERIFGEGSMANVMLDENVPKTKKLKALSSLSNHISPVSLKIIKQTLSSRNDEIRMYGYAIINKVEKRLNEDINRYLEVYKNSADDDEKKYEAAKELAFSYWEMVYTELSHESLRDNFLKEVVSYLSVAKDYYARTTKIKEDGVETLTKEVENLSQQESLTSEELEKLQDMKEKLEDKKVVLKHYKDSTAKLFVLMGRVYMMKKEYESAITEFTVAQELSASNSSFVLPYLAEIYFIIGKFYIVKSILNKAESLELNARLYPIMQQWRS